MEDMGMAPLPSCVTPVRQKKRTLETCETPPAAAGTALASTVSPMATASAAVGAARDAEEERLVVGDIVEVQSRTWPGINKPGGVGKIVRCNPDGTYNVSYVLGGSEKKVQRMFIRNTASFMRVQQRTVKERDFFINYDQKEAMKQRRSSRRGSESVASSTPSVRSDSPSSVRTKKQKLSSEDRSMETPPPVECRESLKIKLRTGNFLSRKSSDGSRSLDSPTTPRADGSFPSSATALFRRVSEDDMDDLERPRKPLHKIRPIRNDSDMDDLEKPRKPLPKIPPIRRVEKEAQKSKKDEPDRQRIIVQLKKKLMNAEKKRAEDLSPEKKCADNLKFDKDSTYTFEEKKTSQPRVSISRQLPVLEIETESTVRTPSPHQNPLPVTPKGDGASAKSKVSEAVVDRSVQETSESETFLPVEGDQKVGGVSEPTIEKERTHHSEKLVALAIPESKHENHSMEDTPATSRVETSIEPTAQLQNSAEKSAFSKPIPPTVVVETGIVSNFLKRKQTLSQVESAITKIVEDKEFAPMTRETSCFPGEILKSLGISQRSETGVLSRKRNRRLSGGGVLRAQLQLQRSERKDMLQRFSIEHNKTHRAMIEALCQEMSRDCYSSHSRLESACLAVNKFWRPVRSGPITPSMSRSLYRRVGKHFLRVRDVMLERQEMEAAILHSKQRRELLCTCPDLTPAQIESDNLCPMVPIRYPFQYE